MGMKRRIFSLLLCLVMVLSLVPTAAFAAEAPAKYTITVNGGKAYTDYSARFELTEAEAGQTVVLATSGIDFAGWEVVSPAELTISGGTMASFTMPASNVVVTAKHSETPAAETYNVWVNGVQFTEDQLTVACGTGTATYNPDTNTVTLDGAQITNAYELGAIYANDDLTVNVIGDSSITLDNSTDAHGIYVDGNLALNVSKNLEICAENDIANGICAANGNITLSGSGDVTINAGRYGIFASASMMLSGSGDVTVVAVDSAIYANYNVTLAGSGNLNVTSKFKDGIYADNIVTISDSVNVTANSYDYGIRVRGKVLLDGTGSSVTLHAGKKAVFNSKTKESLVAGANFDKYSVTGDPASNSVVYTWKGTSYGVWVDGTEITSVNKNDVLGDGTVSYDPESNTVTLDGAQITGAYDYGAIRAKGALTVNVAGDSSITLDSSTDAHGIFAEGNLTLTGTGNLGIQVDADDCDGIEVWNDATISGSGDVTIRSECYGVYSVMGKLILSGSGNVDIYGEGAGCYGENMQVLLNGTGSSVKLGGGYKSVNNDDGASIVAGENFSDYDVTGDPASTSVTYTRKVVAYDVWVSNVQFTSNKLTITCGTGTATYDPDANTVTLDGAQITKATDKGAIYADKALTVNVVGDSSIHLDSDTKTIGGIYADTLVLNASNNLDVCVENNESRGIYTNGSDIRFPDSGNVTINGGGDVTISAGDKGIFSTGSVTFSGSGDVTIAARSHGIYCYDSMTINGIGNVNITSQYSYGIFEYGDVTISNSANVKIKGFYSGVCIGKVEDSGRSLILSGSGEVDIGGANGGVQLYGDGKVFLNGTGSPVKMHAGPESPAVYNGDTKESPVAGSSLDDYEVIGSPDSASVIYCKHENIDIKNAVSPTCTAEGYTGDVYCKDCGKMISAGNPIAKLEHDYEQTATYDPTCTEDGYGEMTCKYCGDTFTFKMYDAFGHHEVTDKAVAATYTKTGKTEGSHCDICGQVLTAQKTVAMKKLSRAKITSITNTKDGITVKWGKVTGATAYQVYRKVGTGSWKLIKTTTSTSLSNTSLTNGTKYQYKVRAVAKNSAGKVVNTGAYSAIKTMYRLTRPTLASGTKNIATRKIVVKWNKNTKVTGYQVKYIKGTTTKTVTVKGASSLTKTLSSLTKGATYKVYVRSYKTVSGTNYYSAWSAYKSVKVAK